MCRLLALPRGQNSPKNAGIFFCVILPDHRIYARTPQAKNNCWELAARIAGEEVVAMPLGGARLPCSG